MSSRLRMTRAEKDALAEAIRGTLCYRESEEPEKPTVDAVPVVRCKDCKYSHMTYSGECKYCQLDIARGRTEATYRDGNWYCADGERREDDAKEST